MNIYFHKNFAKKYARLRLSEKKRFKERQELFLQDPFHPVLNNHALDGKYKGSRSINISGDLRAVYDVVAADAILFVDIGTHSNLYK